MNISEIDFIPALYKIYDEIIVNAADNKVRDPNQTLIKVDISKVCNASYCMTHTVTLGIYDSCRIIETFFSGK